VKYIGKKMIKILLLAPSKQDPGGVASFCKLLIKYLDHDFSVDYLEIANRPGNSSIVKQAYFFLSDTITLIRRLKRKEYKVIHLNPSFKILALIRDSFFLVISSRFYHQRTLVIFHGWDESLIDKIIGNPLLKFFFLWVYNKAMLILVLCTRFKEQLEKIGISQDNVRVITTMYQAKELKSKGYKKRQNSKMNILFMSRILRSKGAFIAVEVARLFKENGYKNVKLHIAGDGPDFAELKNRIVELKLCNYVKAKGYLSGEEKLVILNTSDIFLFPTYYGEGCPIVLLEALGFGLAVVSTPIAAIPEIIEHGINGFIIDSKNPIDFFNATRELIDNHALLRDMQNVNRKKAIRNYEARAVSHKIGVFYHELIKQEIQ